MTSAAGDAEQVEIRARAEWRAWLEREHGRAHGVWVVGASQLLLRTSSASC